MQAIILAAGMGKRLKELTNDSTKCMVKVNGVTMIERMLRQLDSLNLSKIVVVVGYKSESLMEFIDELSINTPIEYVNNEIYDKTNNIYSLYMAKDYLLAEDTLLLESDLVFEDAVLDVILNDPHPSLALVAKYESWMDGTVVVLNENNSIHSFLDKKHFRFEDIGSYYKTVNIYKFSTEFSKTQYVPFLEAYLAALGTNEYYEQVLKIVLHLDKPGIKAVPLSNHERWYEIDDVQDLDIAESIFATSKEDKYAKMSARYGGYWRYPGMMDYCYLVNPFYPPQKLLDEMKASFERVACEYPSGMSVNSLLAAKYFGLKQSQIVVGNGAAELIKSLMGKIEGAIGMVMPTFEEYPNRKSADDIVAFYPQNSDFSYTADDLMGFYGDKEISALLLINPDNPSGNYIKKEDVLRLAVWAQDKGICLIMDESFVDFATDSREQTLLCQEVLVKYDKLVVVKSISKSYGVPGLRLGILASGDEKLIRFIKKDVSIWNINSLGEFYLQIAEKYQADYRKGMKRFWQVREEFLASLGTLRGVRVIPTQANFVMCEITGQSALALATTLLSGHDIFIKDLSAKRGIEGQYIRLAIKSPQENQKLLNALRDILGTV